MPSIFKRKMLEKNDTRPWRTITVNGSEYVTDSYALILKSFILSELKASDELEPMDCPQEITDIVSKFKDAPEAEALNGWTKNENGKDWRVFKAEGVEPCLFRADWADALSATPGHMVFGSWNGGTALVAMLKDQMIGCYMCRQWDWEKESKIFTNFFVDKIK